MTIAVGCYTNCTKNWLVLITDSVCHTATLNQGRWSLLAGACNESGVSDEAQREYVKSLCAALPGWVAQVEKDKAF